ncbi:Ig-like domain-containing protein [Streptosporangium sp. NPDC023825]|uniref:Ig-like domain-containing protein n=1 Tax=Streptosporangium sp. NPDC023825 TaxID=3154909 RepID=UPI003442F53E
MIVLQPFIGLEFANEQGHVEVVPEVRVAFLEPVTGTRFALKDPAGHGVDITATPVEGDDPVWVITPVHPLLPGTTYRLEITSARDMEDNVVADYATTFTTEG